MPPEEMNGAWRRYAGYREKGFSDMNRGNVWVSIRGRQQLAEAFWEESMDMVTSGTLSRDPEGYTLTYMEDQNAGMGRTQTTILFGGGRVVMHHRGEVNTHMVFEKGCKHVSYYDTEVGALTLGVSTTGLRCDVGGAGVPIDLELEYTLEIDNEITGTNTLSIRVSDKDGASGGDDGAPINAKPPQSLKLSGNGMLLN
jgi:uncharacterized beta-barrel protein YwiB (DUF1934 family)